MSAEEPELAERLDRLLRASPRSAASIRARAVVDDTASHRRQLRLLGLAPGVDADPADLLGRIREEIDSRIRIADADRVGERADRLAEPVHPFQHDDAVADAVLRRRLARLDLRGP